MISFLECILISVMSGRDISGSLEDDQYEVTNGENNFYLTGWRDITVHLKNENKYTFKILGGATNIYGDGKTVEVNSSCSLKCTDERFYVIYVVGSSTQFTIEKCNFVVFDDFTSVIFGRNASRIHIDTCKLSGNPFMFARVENISDLKISNCTFEDLQEDNVIPYIFLGYMLTIVNCNRFQLINCTFHSVSAGVFNEGLFDFDIGGYAAVVYIEDSLDAYVSRCVFVNCSGLLAGAIFSFTTDANNKYHDLQFSKNSYTIPLNKLMNILRDLLKVVSASVNIPFLYKLIDYFKDLVVMGTDVTRVGTVPIAIETVCSDSARPQFRDGFSLLDFEPCEKLRLGKKGIKTAVVVVIVVVVCVVAAGVAAFVVWYFCYRKRKFCFSNCSDAKISNFY